MTAVEGEGVVATKQAQMRFGRRTHLLLLHLGCGEGCAVVAVPAEAVVVERLEEVREPRVDDRPDALLRAHVAVHHRLVERERVCAQDALDVGQRATEDAPAHDAQRVLRLGHVQVHGLVRQPVDLSRRPVRPVGHEEAARHVLAVHGRAGGRRILLARAQVPRVHPQVVPRPERV